MGGTPPHWQVRRGVVLWGRGGSGGRREGGGERSKEGGGSGTLVLAVQKGVLFSLGGRGNVVQGGRKG